MRSGAWLLLIAACANADAAWETPGLRFQDEGVHKGYATAVNCAGAGITCAVAGGKATLTVPGGGGTGTPGGVSGNIQVNDGLGGFGAYTGTSCAYAVKTLNASGTATCTAAPTIPADISGASYWTRVAEAGLSNETALGALATGILLNTTTTGAPTIYAGLSCPASTYLTDLDSSGNGTCAQVTTGQLSGTITDAQLANNYSGVGACAANQYANTLNDNAGPTCSQVAYAQVSGTPTIPTDISGASYITKVAEANLSNEFALGSLATGLLKNTTTTGVPVIYAGTSCTNQFPRSLDTSGAATCASVAAATDVTGILPLANGGTNANLTANNGAIPYSDASKFVLLGPGTAGQVLQTNGAAAPTWASEWQFLGTATGATTTVGPITWTATTRYVMCAYQIIGYNGGTPVGRFLMGTASISTTARTNSYAISEGVTAPTTASGATATPGIPLAVTLSAVGRMGNVFVDGQSGSVKTINVLGQNQTPAVATVPTIFQGASFFSDLGTNLAITRAQLTVYDNLTAIAPPR
jgi:hypothetical protein